MKVKWTLGQIYARLATLVFLTFGFAIAASAHTDDSSTARIVQKGDRLYSVDVSMLATDFERMFSGASEEEHDEDLSAPGALENAIGRFLLTRIALESASGEKCRGSVDTAGEDPKSDEDVRVVMTWDCSAVKGDIFYNAAAFLKVTGPSGKHQVFIGTGTDAAQAVLDHTNARFDLSAPHANLWERDARSLYARIEPILPGYDLVAVML
jgi:hypothetical protein